MAAWRGCKLGEVVNLKRGYDLPRNDRVSGPFPIVSSSGIIDHHAEAKVTGPGVITGRYGTLGEVFFVEEDFWPLNTSLYVQDFKGNDPRFISYFLRQLNFGTRNAAGAVPGVNRNHLHTIDVCVPPLPVQLRIAGILSAYDERMENSQRRIRILEAMARALYREWFVHFRFPGHEKLPRVASPFGDIPQGWEVKTLGDLIKYNRRATKPGPHLDQRKYVPIDCLPLKSLALMEAKPIEEAQSSLQLFEKGDLLFGAMRPYFHKVVVAPFAGVTRTTCFVFKPRLNRNGMRSPR
jgi:type I restriction enzyme, S subunit